MKPAEIPTPGSARAITFLLVFLMSGPPAWSQTAYRAGAQDLARTRSIAESQHEIVILLIQKKEYDRALEEADKIFNMQWPDDQEPTLLSALIRRRPRITVYVRAPDFKPNTRRRVRLTARGNAIAFRNCAAGSRNSNAQ
jgi:hypothetical protein